MNRIESAKQFYYRGDLAKYTGKSEILHGGMFYEVQIIELGRLFGHVYLTQRLPEYE